MKTRFDPMVAGLLLAALATGFGQPVITTQPQSCTNVVGTTATFTVEATGTDPLPCQWQKLSGNWSDLADCTNAAMALTNVRSSDEADYRGAVRGQRSEVRGQRSEVGCQNGSHPKPPTSHLQAI